MLTPLNLPSGPALCYSGYRQGQGPDRGIYPTLAQIREDLHLLAPHWPLLRLYDCSLHAERVLQVIAEDRLPLRLMLGAHLAATASNPGCPWGGLHSDEQLAVNHRANDAELERLVTLARRHEDLIFSVAVGNECTVDWTDHLVPVPQMVKYLDRVKQALKQPLTFCENHLPWQHKLNELVPLLDFISVHSYPLWEYKPIHEALACTRQNIESVARCHPGKPIVITEAGWCTASNGRGMQAGQAVPELQAVYVPELIAWARKAGLLCFVFEAFDEPWKGSPDPLEPEKHWGLYTVDRQPKLAMRRLAGEPH